jgi:hypothetical protein
MAFRFSSAKAAVMMACLLLAAMSAICQSLFPACAEMLCGSVELLLRRRFAGCSLALAVQLCLVEFASANKVCVGGSIPARFDDAERKERCEMFPLRGKRSVGIFRAVRFRNGLTMLRGKRDVLLLRAVKDI